MNRFRLGIVPYLNALPLYWTLQQSGAVELVPRVPSQLEILLEKGEVDAALLPVADHLRGIGDGILGDAIIGATGKVRSVLLFSRVPIEAIESVALDTSSHSSVALLKIILRDFYRVEPKFQNHAPHLATMLQNHDAALLIGDPALEAAQDSSGCQVFDLAQEWRKATGLSFVFAAWTARKNLENRAQLEALLQAARDEGVNRIGEIVAANPLQTHLADSVVQSYLTAAIEFRMSESHRAGMAEFARRL